MSGRWKPTPGKAPRKSRLPANWDALVAATRERAGGRCQGTWPDGSRCDSPGTDCDHIEAGDDHTRLQWLCTWHHKAKTNKEARDARGPNEGRHPRHR